MIAKRDDVNSDSDWLIFIFQEFRLEFNKPKGVKPKTFHLNKGEIDKLVAQQMLKSEFKNPAICPGTGGRGLGMEKWSGAQAGAGTKLMKLGSSGGRGPETEGARGLRRARAKN